MPQGKAVIGQSGGPTAVINRSLVGFIKEAAKSDFDEILGARHGFCLLYTSPSPRDDELSRMPSSA